MKNLLFGGGVAPAFKGSSQSAINPKKFHEFPKLRNHNIGLKYRVFWSVYGNDVIIFQTSHIVTSILRIFQPKAPKDSM